MRPAASMSMLVGFLSMGDRAHNVTSRSSGTEKISSGTSDGGALVVGASAAALAVPNADRTTSSTSRIFAVIFMLSPSERIGDDVRVDERLLAFLARPGVAMLHAEHAVEPLATDMAKEILVVHLAGAGLLASRVVADLEIGDLAPGNIDVL